jgi:hypothetical protein
MRSLTRIATGLAIFGLAFGRLAAQEPAPAPEPDSPPPAAASSDPAPETLMAPSDPFPADAPSSDETAQASSAPANPAAEPAAAPADVPAAEAKIEASALELPVAPPAVDVSTAVSPASEETPGGRRSSDWIFVGIVALAAAAILRRVARGERGHARESVSIHGSVEALDASALESSGPPILRPTSGTSRFERNGRVRA